jgi:hypothetical protein
MQAGSHAAERIVVSEVALILGRAAAERRALDRGGEKDDYKREHKGERKRGRD